MDNFKPNYRTTEFFSSALTLIAIAAFSFFGTSAILASHLMTAVCAGYIISRSLFKRNRYVLIYNGHKSSEFGFFLAGVVLNTALVVAGRLGTNPFLINLASLEIVFSLCCGFRKGLTLQSSRTTISL